MSSSSDDGALLTREELLEALRVVRSSPLKIRRTPTILVADTTASEGKTNKSSNLLFTDAMPPQPAPGIRLHLKLENGQATHSFKIRGIANQVAKRSEEAKRENPEVTPHFVCMSGGNYGLSMAHAATESGVRGTVLLPTLAPRSRAAAMERAGADVIVKPLEELLDGVDKHMKEHNSIFLKQDDKLVIAGHASLGAELAEDLPSADVILVGVGNGGMLAGLGAMLRTVYGKKREEVKLYGVEPEGANAMYLSMKEGRPVQTPKAFSIAAGLAAPFAGANAYRHVAEHADGILLVSEQDLVSATRLCFERGLRVEPAGAASLAAVLYGQLAEAEGPALSGKTVVAVLTGGNSTPEELADMFKRDCARLRWKTALEGYRKTHGVLPT